MKKIFSFLVHLGIMPEHSPDRADEIKVINSVKVQSAVMIWIAGILTIIWLPEHMAFMLGIMVAHFIAATLILGSNAFGYHRFAKWAFVLDPAFLVIAMTAYFGIRSNFQYIALLCFLMYIFLFREKRNEERVMLWTYMSICMIGLWIVYSRDIQISGADEMVLRTMRFIIYVFSTGLAIMFGLILQKSTKNRSIRTKETLEESQRDSIILQSISDSMEEAIFKSSIESGFVFVNEAFTKMFGYDSKEDIKNTHPVNLYGSKYDRDALLTRILNQGKVVNALMHYRRKDGTYFWGQLNCQRMLEGSNEFLIGTIIDVTSQQEQTERLEVSERQLKEAQRLAKLGNWRICPEEERIEWSAECSHVHGFLPDEVKDPFQKWVSGLHDITLEEIERGINRGDAMNRDFEFGSWYETPDGERKYLYYICRHDQKAGNLTWYGTVQDTTELKNQELELISTRAFYQNILDQIPVETVLIDENLKYFYLSKNAVADEELRSWLIGKGNQDYATYRNLDSDFAKERDAKWTQAFESNLTVRWEEVMKTKDGRDSYHLRNLVPITLQLDRNTKRFLIGYSFDINDIKTAQFRLERNNEELKKLNKELDRFVYSISHDLRAPIASVLGLNALAEECEDQEEMESLLAMQREALDRLDRYIRDVIDYARNKRLDLRPDEIYLKPLIESCLSDLEYMSKFHNLEFFIEVEESCMSISDGVRMKIIINNLLSNAIKYADQKKDKSYVSLHAEKSKNVLHLVVSDNGIGIKKEYHDQIWEIFFRGISDVPGSGLGLYILNESIKNLKGTIEMESEEGKGTTFKLSIPDMAD